MNFYFAPLEGITGYLYRNAHHTYFPKVDKYFSPFIITNQKEKIKSKNLNDILPDNNKDIHLIPQLLSNHASDFIETSKRMKQFGYEEINLNLGCPSGTVVSKNKGSGFLARKEELDDFLYHIFSEAVTKISIKTRIGKDDPDEFYQLIEIFNKYPIKELIIHPRIQKDFYKNKPNLKVFRDALVLSKNPVCYNGDIHTISDYKKFVSEYPDVDTIMCGRGLIMNPGLIGTITDNINLEKNLLKDFHERLYEDYKQTLYGEKNVLYKMKEIWFYMIPLFTNHEKYAKQIKKAERLSTYEDTVRRLFQEQEIIVK